MKVKNQQNTNVNIPSLYAPSIPFKESKKSKDKDDEGEYKQFDVKINAADATSADKAKQKVLVFTDGTAEEWVTWRMNVDDLIRDLNIADIGDKKVATTLTVLSGAARARFQTSYRDRQERNAGRPVEARLDTNTIYGFAMEDLGKFYFPTTGDPWRKQVNYLRHEVKMSDYTYDLRTFAARLRRLNDYLAYFPKRPNGNPSTKLPEDELVAIMNHAKPDDWTMAALASNIDPDTMMWDNLVEYFLQLELRSQLQKRAYSQKNIRRKRADDDDDDDNTSNARTQKDNRANRNNSNRTTTQPVKCKHCGKFHRGQCWLLEENKHLRPPAKKTKTGEAERVYQLTTEQLNYMIGQLPFAKQKKTGKKRKIRPDSDDEGEESMNQFNKFMLPKKATNSSNNHSSDSESSYPMSTSSTTKQFCYNTTKVDLEEKKKQKVEHKTTEIVIELMDRDGKLVPIRALLDTGTTATLVLRKYVAPGKAKSYKGHSTTWKTLGGQFQTNQKCQLQMRLPEFDYRKEVTWICHVDGTTNPEHALYDMIIGTDMMGAIGMDILFSENSMKWEHMEVPMKNRGVITDRQVAEMIYHLNIAPDVLKTAESRQNRILDADYRATDLNEYTANLTHLTAEQQRMLYDTLSEHENLFKGGLGTINVPPIHLELNHDPNMKPYHARPFPVPKCYEETTKTELDRLCRIGVIAEANDSEWAAPTFIQPKKTGDVRVLTDFRELNKFIKRKPFPLPKISDLLQKLEGFKYATAIDLSMGYYHVQLDEESQNLCSFVMPWGKYKYLRLPMGIKNSPDIFQGIISKVFGGLENVRAYLDDILITTDGSYEDHLKQVETVLKRLSEYGFVVNVKKSFFAVSEIEYLGYWITREGIQPQPKKVEAIQRLTSPKTKRQLRRFLGMINYYRDMWKRRSHLIAPLTALVSKKATFTWTKSHENAFQDIKKVISRETLLAYPDFNKEFHIHTDASDYQLGAVIMQGDRPLAFYSRKMNSAQRRYTTGEQELLSIVETLKEYRNILLGQKLIVHTDHQNLLYKKLSTDRLIRWRLLLEEYDVRFVHIKGEQNVVADALSRLDTDFESEIETKPDMATMASYVMATKEMSETDFPMSPRLIAKYQKKDKALKKELFERPSKYDLSIIEEVELVTKDTKIYVPARLQHRIVEWYHEYLAHPGQTRTEETIKQLFTWPKLGIHVEQYCKTCKQCQLSKKVRKKYGHLPPKQANTTPWSRVDVDLIGPYTVKTPQGVKQLRALTMIDPATGWFEVVSVTDATAHTVMEAFNNEWLSRYPRPQNIGFDNGSEFKRQFAETCKNFDIKPKPSTSHNPQANGIVERVHLVLGDMLRTFELEKQNLDENDPWRPFLSAAAWAIRSTYHTTLQATPGQLVFQRDMLLPIKFKANWARINERKQNEINKNNARENNRRIPHDYKVGEKVLVTKPGIQGKMSLPREGPYPITKVFTNGTVRIQRGAINDRINIRRLTPYYERSN